MANTVVTNSTITAFDTVTTIAAKAAVTDTVGTAEVFEITPTRPGHSCVLVIGGTGAAAAADMTFTVAASELWAGATVTGTITKGTVKMIQLETAKVLKKDGKIYVSLKPGAADKLKTEHAAYVEFIELR